MIKENLRDIRDEFRKDLSLLEKKYISLLNQIICETDTEAIFDNHIENIENEYLEKRK